MVAKQYVVHRTLTVISPIVALLECLCFGLAQVFAGHAIVFAPIGSLLNGGVDTRINQPKT